MADNQQRPVTRTIEEAQEHGYLGTPTPDKQDHTFAAEAARMGGDVTVAPIVTREGTEGTPAAAPSKARKR